MLLMKLARPSAMKAAKLARPLLSDSRSAPPHWSVDVLIVVRRELMLPAGAGWAVRAGVLKDKLAW